MFFLLHPMYLAFIVLLILHLVSPSLFLSFFFSHFLNPSLYVSVTPWSPVVCGVWNCLHETQTSENFRRWMVINNYFCIREIARNWSVMFGSNAVRKTCMKSTSRPHCIKGFWMINSSILQLVLKFQGLIPAGDDKGVETSNRF